MKFCCSLLICLVVFSCHIVNDKSYKASQITFEKISYSKLFGVLKTENFKQVFYIHDKDTQWGIKFYKQTTSPKIAVLSTVFAGFIELLNQQELLVAVDNEKFYSDTLILNKLFDKSILAVGEEGQIQIEKLLAQKPDYLVCGTFDFNKSPTGQKLEKLGIKILYCDNFKEQHPLARAEWIKFFGVLTGQSEKANRIFNLVESNYNKIVSKRKSETILHKPYVMVDAMFGDSWFVPGANSFTAQLIKDAGGEYIFHDKQPLFVYPLTLEEVLMKAKDADIWIHTNQYATFNELKNADRRYTLFKPYINQKIYNNDKRENNFGGNDYWEKGVGRPDLILSDLYAIFHHENDKIETMNYYRILK